MTVSGKTQFSNDMSKLSAEFDDKSGPATAN